MNTRSFLIPALSAAFGAAVAVVTLTLTTPDKPAVSPIQTVHFTPPLASPSAPSVAIEQRSEQSARDGHEDGQVARAEGDEERARTGTGDRPAHAEDRSAEEVRLPMLRLIPKDVQGAPF